MRLILLSIALTGVVQVLLAFTFDEQCLFSSQVGEVDDDLDAKSSMAPLISPRSATPAAAPQTAASAAERVQSSIAGMNHQTVSIVS